MKKRHKKRTGVSEAVRIVQLFGQSYGTNTTGRWRGRNAKLARDLCVLAEKMSDQVFSRSFEEEVAGVVQSLWIFYTNYSNGRISQAKYECLLEHLFDGCSPRFEAKLWRELILSKEEIRDFGGPVNAAAENLSELVEISTRLIKLIWKAHKKELGLPKRLKYSEEVFLKATTSSSPVIGNG